MENNFIKGMILGTLLGDSGFHSSKKKNKGIFIGHSEKQLDYLQYKVNLINNYLSANTVVHKYEFKSGFGYQTRLPFYKFYSKAHHKITYFYNLLCDKDGIKHITKNAIEKHFNDVSLAFLFMDDGCKEVCWNRQRTEKKIKSFKISLGGFSLEEVELLNNFIFEKFDLVGKVYLEHNKYPMIKYSTQESRDKLLYIISPYILPSMRYKIVL